MSRKRPSLFKEQPASVETPSAAVDVKASPQPEAPQPPRTALVRRRGTESPGRPPSRQGKRVVSVYVEPEAAMQLGILAIRKNTSVQALMVEAVNDFFAKRGMHRIA